MRVFFVLLSVVVVVAAAASPCKRYISLSIDVSASVSVQNVTNDEEERAIPNSDQLKDAIKGALSDYLFRDKQSCLAVYTFGTAAQRVTGFVSVATVDGQNRLLGVIDGLTFETSHPRFYTNWEAGLEIVASTEAAEPVTAPHSSWVYLVTDGFPTTRSTGCAVADQPCDGLDVNLRAAVEASKRLISAGTGVVGVGVGDGVDDNALASISGPCQTCAKGWNYFHIHSFKNLEEPLGQSFGQRLALGHDAKATVPMTTTTPTTTTTTPTTTTTTTPTTTTTTPTTTTTTPTTTTTTTPTTTTTTPTTTTTSTTSTTATTTTAATTTTRHTTAQMEDDIDVGSTEVHTDAWTAAIAISIIAGVCIVLGLILACVLTRKTPYPAHVQQAEQEAAEEEAEDDVESIAVTGYRIDTPMLMQSSFHGGSSAPRLVPSRKTKTK